MHSYLVGVLDLDHTIFLQIDYLANLPHFPVAIQFPSYLSDPVLDDLHMLFQPTGAVALIIF